MRRLSAGYYIFMANSKESSGWEKVAHDLQNQINEAEKEWDIEFLSNAKIDSDNGAGREIYYGFQCAVLRPKKSGKN